MFIGNRHVSGILIFGVSVIALLAFGSSARADLVTNGTFTVNSNGAAAFASNGETDVCVSTNSTPCISTIDGWTTTCVSGSADTCGPSNPLLNVLDPNNPLSQHYFNNGNGLNLPISAPPLSGNVIAGDGDPTYGEPLQQTITGLTAGDSYVLSFYEAVDAQAGYSSPFSENWQVSLGSQTNGSTSMTYSDQTPVWTAQTMTFTAAGSSEVLQFLAVGPVGAPPIALLGDVSLTQATPEPSYYAAMGLGFAGLFAMMWRRRRRA